ncbi:SDR family oxidoreductase [Haloechinothrix sp. LS1_15]|uniref:SDR family oxidoreductase n=1 Tax=Haloechinothrix sp. LS1_15 TaxID=2652248 RepID=UPI002948A549|nr:SDR family oxidoreductase [Haloechinothrix sp. LS1_15]MDV6014723.1 SDR family oxidoreductase [Haloechinothrix sp. LS1_15]
MSGQRIAIVGMACRYPDATTPAELWHTVLGRRRAFRRIPEGRLPEPYRGSRTDVDRSYASHAAVLRDWSFDRERFGVGGPLFRAADSTHWLALETAAAALTDAGFAGGNGLNRDTVGVILGNSLAGEFSRAAMLRLRWPFLADATATALEQAGVPGEVAGDVLGRLEELVKQPFPAPGDETLAGSLSNTIAGRICNHFDFHGTGYTVDGACSSSLLAVMTACRALASRECDFVLAGGVDMSLDPLELVGFSRLSALAEDEMRVYDAQPTGFLPGEGCGVVALMRADDADLLGLRPYAYVAGWASSSDGSGGLTRPERAGQALALHRAYQLAGLHPAQAGLIEGHGTGTTTGDTVELETLLTVRGDGAPPAALGSIKANIGHTKAAAGVAGLIKATLAAHHRVLPPATGCRNPHPLLGDASGETVPLRLLPEAEPWTDEVPRAGVSSMGFGGINVHIVLEGRASARTPALSAATRRWSATTGEQEILVLGAGTRQGLVDRLAHLAGTARELSAAELRDISATAWYHQESTQPWRAALVAATPGELAAAASAAATVAASWDGSPRFDPAAGYALGSSTTLRFGMLFPGQAAPVRPQLPWWTRHLDVPDLPSRLPDADGTGGDHADAGGAVDTELAQPAILGQSLAALAWLDELGCTAVGAAGHSLGELTALHWGGSCSAEQALHLATLRGRLMSEHGVADTTMAAIAGPAERVEPLLDGTGVVIACYNAPDRVAVAGRAAAVATVCERAGAAGFAAYPLPVSHAFHSDAMRPVEAPWRETLDRVELSPPRRGLISTVTGEPLECSGEQLRELLVRQLTEPVLFTRAVAELAERCDLLIEAGPGTTLAGLAAATCPTTPVLSIDSGGHPRHHAMVTAVLGACAGADLHPWFVDRAYRPLRLDAEPVFVTSPCEDRSGWSSGPTATATAIPRTTVTEQEAASPQQATPQPAAEIAVAGADPLTAFTEHLAGLLELSPEAISPAASLLGDLHMTSLQVTDAVGAVAAALGKQLPSAPLSLANATVADAADVLAGLADAGTPAGQAGEGEEAGPGSGVSGIRGWVRQLSSHWIPFTLPDPRDAVTGWQVHAPQGHWLHELASGDGPEPPGMAVALTGETSSHDVAELLGDIGTTQPAQLLVIHNGHPAAAGLGRSAAAELDSCRVTVVDVADPDAPLPVAELAGGSERYLELRRDTDGSFERSTTVARQATDPDGEQHDPCTTALPAGVWLVTGGVRSIAAYTAAELAERAGATLVFAGRSPADDPAVAPALADLDARVPAHYVRCDVTDPGAVAELVAAAEQHGPIRGIIHGAGVNEPRRMSEVTPESLERTLSPKVDGLRTLLAETGDELRLLLGFGSIIGRQGLAGQAEYCIANDWLRAEIEGWAARNPDCRAHTVEWSVWSGIGMGVRLGVLDNLRRQGVEPIGPADGVRAVRELLADPKAPVTVTITSRFPATPTLHVTGPPTPLLRFAERIHTRVPGIEAVADATLSVGSDPYLDDHRIDGVAVLPAVLATEAMAQVAALACGRKAAWSLSDLAFRAPVIPGPSGERTVRLAALAGAGGIDVALRDSSDEFATDRFAGTVLPAADPPEPRAPAQAPEPATGEPHEFYGTVFFHGGRFQRVHRYDELSAFRACAWLHPPAGRPWFSEFHSDELLLGDPGTHDAALHALLACVPHRKALPTGAERFTAWRAPCGPVRVHAVERDHTTDEYTFDVDLVDPAGEIVARWDGLRLRAISGPAQLEHVPLPLIGPWLTRRLIECDLADVVELMTTTGSRQDGSATTLASRITGSPATHDPAGALRVDGHHASASYTGGALLLALAPSPVAVDWERVPDPTQPPGPAAELAGPADRRAAEALRDKLGEAPALATMRVWTAREALVKLGNESVEPLRIDQVTEDGLAAMRSGAAQVVTAKLQANPPADTPIDPAEQAEAPQVVIAVAGLLGG